MSEQSPLNCQSTKLKNAITWMADSIQNNPEKARHLVVQEAELRFDLTPVECEFLDKHFTKATV
nr:hypothetical protein [uncultured Desulfobulbus sp.]